MSTFAIFKHLVDRASQGKAGKNLAHFILWGSNDTPRFLRLLMQRADVSMGQVQVNLDYVIRLIEAELCVEEVPS